MSVWRTVVVGTALATLVSVPAAREPSQPQLAPPDQFVVSSGGHPLTVWSRRPPAPRAAILLVHGRTWSSVPDFDLLAPKVQRSVMVSLAARGLAVYAADLRGYGATPVDPSGWLTPDRSASDVRNVLAWIAARHRDLPPPALLGWSRGAAVGMLAVQRDPALASALVLFGFVFDPGARFVDTTPPGPPPRARNTAEAARSDFISPAVTPPAVIRAFVDQALRADPVLVDLRGDDEFNELDPARLALPVLVLYGARDPSIGPDAAARFAARLPHAASRRVVLPGADHAAHLENTHEAWIDAVVGFLGVPAPR